MGQTQNYTDSSISVYIALGKRFYLTGEMVEGIVHVNCATNRPYV